MSLLRRRVRYRNEAERKNIEWPNRKSVFRRGEGVELEEVKIRRQGIT